MSVEGDLQKEQVGHLDLSHFVGVEGDVPVAEVLRRMREEDQNCALVLGADGRLAGIFTERDVLQKVATRSEALGSPVAALMTPAPHTVQQHQPVAFALKFMNAGHFRHVPVVDPEGKIVGNLTHNAIIRFLCDRLPAVTYNLPPSPVLVARAPEGA